MGTWKGKRLHRKKILRYVKGEHLKYHRGGKIKKSTEIGNDVSDREDELGGILQLVTCFFI